jgi:hypothetical protein
MHENRKSRPGGLSAFSGPDYFQPVPSTDSFCKSTALEKSAPGAAPHQAESSH